MMKLEEMHTFSLKQVKDDFTDVTGYTLQADKTVGQLRKILKEYVKTVLNGDDSNFRIYDFVNYLKEEGLTVNLIE